MPPFAPLLAAVDPELIKVVVIIVIFVVAGVAQLLAKIRQIPPPAGRPNPPAPGPVDVVDEIEDFLRRAAGRGAKGEQPVRVEPPPPATPPQQPVLTEVAAEQPVQPVGRQVAQQVEQYLDEQDFSRRTEELGKEVAQADREIDQRLHQTFDHRVSRLAAAPGEAAAPPVAYEPPDLVGAAAEVPATFATGLLDLMTSPDSLRQAVILNEIIHRPEERWG